MVLGSTAAASQPVWGGQDQSKTQPRTLSGAEDICTGSAVDLCTCTSPTYLIAPLLWGKEHGAGRGRTCREENSQLQPEPQGFAPAKRSQTQRITGQ